MKPRKKLALLGALILINVAGVVTSARQEQGKVPAPVATESATPLPTETATSEFTATPSATATEVFGTLVAINSGFELNSDDDAIPDDWQGKLLLKDKQICNKLNRPGKPDKIVAHQGNCAFQFSDGGGKLIQTLTTPYGANNYIIDVSAMKSGKNLTTEYKIIVKLTYQDTTTSKFFLPIDTGTYEYAWSSTNAGLTDTVIKTKLIIKGGAGTGRLWLDDVLLRTYFDSPPPPDR